VAEALNAVKMTKKYRPFLDAVAPGARIINYSVKATGRPCDICGHNPEDRGGKEGYEFTSDEMRLMPRSDGLRAAANALDLAAFR